MAEVKEINFTPLITTIQTLRNSNEASEDARRERDITRDKAILDLNLELIVIGEAIISSTSTISSTIETLSSKISDTIITAIDGLKSSISGIGDSTKISNTIITTINDLKSSISGISDSTQEQLAAVQQSRDTLQAQLGSMLPGVENLELRSKI